MPSSKESAPTATAAVYSPRLWPATKSGCETDRAPARHRQRDANSAGCATSVAVSSSIGPSRQSCGSAGPDGLVGEREVARRTGPAASAVEAHADLLRALARERGNASFPIVSVSSRSLDARRKRGRATGTSSTRRRAPRRGRRSGGRGVDRGRHVAERTARCSRSGRSGEGAARDASADPVAAEEDVGRHQVELGTRAPPPARPACPRVEALAEAGAQDALGQDRGTAVGPHVAELARRSRCRARSSPRRARATSGPVTSTGCSSGAEV